MKWSIPERLIEEGRSLVDEKRVLSINASIEEKIWTADVLDDDRYRIELDGTTREQDFCECDYWKNHGFCKHTVAVELELKDREISRVMTPENAEKVAKNSINPGKELTLLFSRQFLEDTNSLYTGGKKQLQTLKLEYKIEHKPESTALIRHSGEVLVVSIRAGLDKLYVIKDLHGFLTAFSNKDKFEYKSNQWIDFSEVEVEKTDAALLQELYVQMESQNFVRGSFVEAKSIFNNKRYFVLTPSFAKTFIEKYQEEADFSFDVSGAQFKTVAFIEGRLPFGFELNSQEGAVKLNIDNNTDVYLKDYHWFLVEDKIYQPTREQLKAIQPLQSFLQRHEGNRIDIQPEDMPDFTAYVLPMISKLATVHMSEEVENTFIHEPLKTCIYFTYANEHLHAVVEFNYRHMVLSTNPEENQMPEENIQVIRDSKKEIQTLNLLNELGYQREETDYTKRLVKDEKFYEFFTKEIPLLEQTAEVYVNDSLDSIFLDQIDPDTTVDIQQEGGLLDIRFDIKGISRDEINRVLQSLMERKSFHKLDNGKLLSLESEELQQISRVLSELRSSKEFENGGISIPSYRGLELSHLLENESGVQPVLSSKFQKMVLDLNQPHSIEAELPKGINGELRGYQVTGFKWLKMLSQYGFGGILADDMGLGKTLQVITYIQSEIEEGEEKPFLIIAPASLTYNWHHELKKFAPNIRATVVSGSSEEREGQINDVVNNNVLITSYQSFRQDVDFYKQQNFSTLVLDESQMVKNYHTKTSQALRSLSVPKKFALSGTPIENKIEELWAIFQLIMPGFFPSIKKFKTLTNEKIAKMIQPFVLRRVKKDVLQELPEKIETNMFSTLTKDQKTVYLAYLQQIQETVQGMSGDDFRKNRIAILASLTRLRQICCDPRLFLDDYEGESGKLLQLKEIVSTALENNKRILIFSQFTSMLDIIQAELEKEDISSFYLSGKTKPIERINMVNKFNDGEKSIFLISLKAGGTGLNLTGADTVILYDLWWNPAVEEQAAGRAHRLGQKNVVEVWRLIAEGTIEEKINALQQEKKSLFDQVITEDHGETRTINQLTEEDIREILSMGMESV